MQGGLWLIGFQARANRVKNDLLRYLLDLRSAKSMNEQHDEMIEKSYDFSRGVRGKQYRAVRQG